MEYTELTVSTTTGGADAVSALLMRLGATGTQIIDKNDLPDPDKPGRNWELMDRALLDAAPKLRLVCEAATGVNNIDTALCASRGIAVRNVAAYSTESVVQTTFMHILSLLGCAPYLDAVVKDGRYSRSGMFTDVSQRIVEADGKTVGIVGMGTIGRRVAAVAEAFGMKVIYFSTSGTNHCADYPAVTLDELL